MQIKTIRQDGPQFLGFRVPKQRTVLYINLEIKAEHMHGRVNRLIKNMGQPSAVIKNRLHIINARGHDINANHILVLARKYKPDIIIIDPLYKMLEGDENATKDMKPVLAMFDRIAEQTGAAVLYVHHNPKGRAGDRDTRDRGAGSGVLARDFDAAIYLTDHVKGQGFVVMSTIARNYPPSDPQSILWSEGRFIKSDEPPIELTSSNARSAATKGEIAPDTVLAHLKEKGPMSKTQLDEMIRGIGATRDGAKDLSSRMIAAKQIVVWSPPGHRAVKWCGTPEQIRAKISETSEPMQGDLPGGAP